MFLLFLFCFIPLRLNLRYVLYWYPPGFTHWLNTNNFIVIQTIYDQHLERPSEDYRFCPGYDRLPGDILGYLEKLTNFRCRKRSENITNDSTHQGYNLFDLLSPERHFGSIRSRTKRLRDSFYPWALCKMKPAAPWHF